MKEIWKDIPNFSGYQVSNLGRVRSFLSHKGSPNIYHISDTPKIMRIRSDKQRRMYVSLRQNGKTFTIMVHLLVLRSFVGPCPAGMEACHYNGNASDNSLSNLRWDTVKNNKADNQRNGTQPQGETHYNTRLTSAQISEIRSRYSSGEKQYKLAIEFRVGQDHISRIVNLKVRKHG